MTWLSLSPPLFWDSNFLAQYILSNWFSCALLHFTIYLLLRTSAKPIPISSAPCHFQLRRWIREWGFHVLTSLGQIEVIITSASLDMSSAFSSCYRLLCAHSACFRLPGRDLGTCWHQIPWHIPATINMDYIVNFDPSSKLCAYETRAKKAGEIHHPTKSLHASIINAVYCVFHPTLPWRLRYLEKIWV